MKRMKMNFSKWMANWQHALIAGVVVLGLAALMMKTPVSADNGESAGKGALIGGLTGATIGGIAGGGKGAGIGLGAGLVGGALFGGLAGRNGGSSYDPYKQLDRLERKAARTRNPAKQAQLQAEINDLRSRLNVPAGQPVYQPRAGY